MWRLFCLILSGMFLLAGACTQSFGDLDGQFAYGDKLDISELKQHEDAEWVIWVNLISGKGEIQQGKAYFLGETFSYAPHYLKIVKTRDAVYEIGSYGHSPTSMLEEEYSVFDELEMLRYFQVTYPLSDELQRFYPFNDADSEEYHFFKALDERVKRLANEKDEVPRIKDFYVHDAATLYAVYVRHGERERRVVLTGYDDDLDQYGFHDEFSGVIKDLYSGLVAIQKWEQLPKQRAIAWLAGLGEMEHDKRVSDHPVYVDDYQWNLRYHLYQYYSRDFWETELARLLRDRDTGLLAKLQASIIMNELQSRTLAEEVLISLEGSFDHHFKGNQYAYAYFMEALYRVALMQIPEHQQRIRTLLEVRATDWLTDATGIHMQVGYRESHWVMRVFALVGVNETLCEALIASTKKAGVEYDERYPFAIIYHPKDPEKKYPIRAYTQESPHLDTELEPEVRTSIIKQFQNPKDTFFYYTRFKSIADHRDYFKKFILMHHEYDEGSWYSDDQPAYRPVEEALFFKLFPTRDLRLAAVKSSLDFLKSVSDQDYHSTLRIRANELTERYRALQDYPSVINH